MKIGGRDVQVDIMSRRHHPPIPLISPDVGKPPGDLPSPASVAEATTKLRSEAHALKEVYIHKGADESIDVVDVIENPNIGIVTLVSFTVPPGLIAVFEQVGVYYSESICAQCQSVGWRLAINGQQAPNINHLSYYWRFSSYGSVSEPMLITPLWVQSGETLEIQIDPNANGVNLFIEHLTIIGRLTGRLIKPASPALLSAGGI